VRHWRTTYEGDTILRRQARDSICSVCGRAFVPAPLHMYRKGGKIQCSYTCYRKAGGDTTESTHKQRGL
jgi:hypothetical protein